MRTTPTTSSMIAASVLNSSLSRPSENPMVAMNRPRTRNERASPAASATGPSLCSDMAVPNTTGRSEGRKATKSKRDLREKLTRVTRIP